MISSACASTDAGMVRPSACGRFRRRDGEREEGAREKEPAGAQAAAHIDVDGRGGLIGAGP